MKKYLKFYCLLVLLAIFTISLNINNKVKAYTWADFISFNAQLKDEATGDIKTMATKFITYKTTIESRCRTNGIEPTDYEYFWINYSNGFPGTFRIFFFNSNPNGTFSLANNRLTISGMTGKRIDLYNISENKFTNQGVSTLNNTSYYDSNSNRLSVNLGLVFPTNDYGASWFNNKYIYIKLNEGISETIFNKQNLPWILGQVKVTPSMDYQNIGIYHDILEYGNYYWEETQNNGEGKIYNFGLINELDIANEETYTIKIVDGQTTRLTSDEFLLRFTSGNETNTTPSGMITNQSGDIIGNIDLSGIESSLDNINNSIISGDNAIIEQLQQNESGDERRFNIFKTWYEGLFTLSSGDTIELKEKLLHIIDPENRSGIYEELEFFEQMRDMQPGDFRLEWPTYYYNNTILIPSGDINFSKYVRENQTFTMIHGITRIVILGAFAIVICRAIWKLIAVTLGIGMEMYETAEDEKQIITSHHETYDIDTNEVTRTTTWRKGRDSVTYKQSYEKRKNL